MEDIIKLVLTLDMLRGKNPMGEKVLSIVALMAYVHVILSCKSCIEVQMFVPGFTSQKCA